VTRTSKARLPDAFFILANFFSSWPNRGPNDPAVPWGPASVAEARARSPLTAGDKLRRHWGQRLADRAREILGHLHVPERGRNRIEPRTALHPGNVHALKGLLQCNCRFAMKRPMSGPPTASLALRLACGLFCVLHVVSGTSCSTKQSGPARISDTASAVGYGAGFKSHVADAGAIDAVDMKPTHPTPLPPPNYSLVPTLEPARCVWGHWLTVPWYTGLARQVCGKTIQPMVPALPSEIPLDHRIAALVARLQMGEMALEDARRQNWPLGNELRMLAEAYAELECLESDLCADAASTPGTQEDLETAKAARQRMVDLCDQLRQLPRYRRQCP
jgi:hypothetical protein